MEIKSNANKQVLNNVSNKSNSVDKYTNSQPDSSINNEKNEVSNDKVANSNPATVTNESLQEEATSKFLKQNGFEPNEQNKQLVNIFSKFGLTANKETIANAIKLLSKMTGSNLDMNSATLLLAKGLEADKLGLISKYFSGDLKFDTLFKLLNNNQANQLKSAFFKGEFANKLLELIAGDQTSSGSDTKVRSSIADNFSENLSFQNLLSSQNTEQTDNKFYFQWPFFWNNSDEPDTLEGEVFVADEEEKKGFSIRLMMSPPSLGNMEISMNRLEEKLWVHFAAEEKNGRQLLSTILVPLKNKLSELGWSQTRVTTGPLNRTNGFFSKSEVVTSEQNQPGVDIKV